MTEYLSRRALLAALGAAAAAGVLGRTPAQAAPGPGVPVPPVPVPIPDLPPLIDASPANFSSPPLRRYLTELPTIPVAGSSPELCAQVSRHRYHPDLPATRVLGYHDSILGPTIEAHRNAPTTLSVRNDITGHPLADAVDTTMHGATLADRTAPRTTVHLHGGPTHPESDGHPVITWRRGGTQVNHYANRQEAATLWYHDHAMAITRLNVQAGLAGFYLVRDEFDTGRPGNPLGLPTGDREVALVVQDRTFNPDGTLQPRMARYQPTGYNQLGQFGDVAVVNGVAWPRMTVRRGLYRFRLLQGSNSRTYRFEFSNGMPFWVIGNDQGLLNRPARTRSIVMTSGERADILVDFGGLDPGTSVRLVNTALNSFGNTVFMIPTLREIMRFDVAPGARLSGAVPDRLRGSGLAPIIPPASSRADRVRTMTFLGRGDFHRLGAVLPLMMSMNNLPFMSDDIDVARAGTTEIWRIANVLPLEHPVHIHLAKFRVLSRQKLASAAYMAAHPPPLAGDVRWNPDPSPFTVGPKVRAAAWESGWKDTTLIEADSVLTLAVRWPSLEELGFDPDAPITFGPGADVHHGTDHALRGYVWHCHNLDHEDHDMMQRIRIRG